MKICVVVPNENYLKQAGVRIRYKRIMAHLEEMGHQLELLPVEEFKQVDHDVYLFSKCFDASALIVAQMALSRGKIVGVDLFDDYFSQWQDSRLQKFRGWLVSFLSGAHFVLCSTPNMQRVAEKYAPHLPVHVMDDPYDQYSIKHLHRKLTRKTTDLWSRRVLNVAWYGIGDNSYYPVGLSDLAAFSAELVALQGKGFDVRLHILTNSRAMTGDALAALSNIPVTYELHEWSESQEQALLAQTQVVFLPVSAQKFSIAKSLNRAVTALCSGNQILSAGFPLYKAFDEYIYRNGEDLLEDLNTNRPRLRSETIKRLDSLLRSYADPMVKARNVVDFLSSVVSHAGKLDAHTAPGRPLAALVHGVESSGTVHKFAKKLASLSVGSPLTSLRVNFDIRFEWNHHHTGLDLLVSDRVSKLLSHSTAALSVPYGKILDTEYRKIGTEALPSLTCMGGHLAACGSPTGKLAAYSVVMSTVVRVMNEVLPDVPCISSENWRLPWPISVDRSSLGGQ
jgi:hypothetical protein